MGTHVRLREVTGKDAFTIFCRVNEWFLPILSQTRTFHRDEPKDFRVMIAGEPVIFRFRFDADNLHVSHIQLLYLERVPEQPPECWELFSRFIYVTRDPEVADLEFSKQP